jgi:hypothetical protein
MSAPSLKAKTSPTASAGCCTSTITAEEVRTASIRALKEVYAKDFGDRYNRLSDWDRAAIDISVRDDLMRKKRKE